MDCIELDIEVVVADEAFDIHPPHPDEEAQELALIAYYQDLADAGDVCAEIRRNSMLEQRARKASCCAHVDEALEAYFVNGHNAHVQAYEETLYTDIPF